MNNEIHFGVCRRLLHLPSDATGKGKGKRSENCASCLKGSMLSSAETGLEMDQTFTQAPFFFEDCTQASTKTMPFSPSSTVG
ncbi:hypothetical protein SAMN05892877_103173 [Rhizobium subbaraonis]|uniref:Uncharacterized protein n=1 Tax=Rhizobium subbaraonis TaxID=908946 RepID=A0A285U4J4_9HYPH|nr:hypothetical protein SAMN05892877_103173 [Rhizobium subbaraonis]